MKHNNNPHIDSLKKKSLNKHEEPRPVTDNNRRGVYIVCALLTAVFIIAVSVVLRGLSEKRVYDNYMRQAQQYYSSSDFDSALSALRKAASVSETDDCLLLMADCYETQGKYDKALEVLRSMNLQNPTVAARIANIDKYRKTLSNAEKVTVAGRQYPLNTTSLVLDNMGLTDAAINEIVQLYALDSLSISGNSIYDISALAQLGGLVSLNISGNNISSLNALSQLTGLRTLYIDNNPVLDITPILGLTNLTNLSIKGIHINKSQLDALSNALPHCAIHSETATEEAQDISFGGVTFKSDVTELNLSGRGLRDISALSNCKNLIKLDLSGNEISDLGPLMNIPSISELNLSGNNLSDIRQLMGLSSLTRLDVSNNQISSTSAFSMMTALNHLNLDNNPIKSFKGLRKLSNINTLSLNNTGLSDNELQYIAPLARMHSLNIENNPLISGEGVDNLKQALGNCAVMHSELAYSIEIQGNLIRTNATELSLPGRGIFDINNITMLKELESIDLSTNYIDNIYPLQFSDSRFVIKTLNLSGNQIIDASPVSLILNLEYLDLSNNLISSELPFMAMSTLKTLVLSGNPLTYEQVDRIRMALPNCTVIF